MRQKKIYLAPETAIEPGLNHRCFCTFSVDTSDTGEETDASEAAADESRLWDIWGETSSEGLENRFSD